MFWRLFFSFLLLVAVSIFVLTTLVLLRATSLFWSITFDVVMASSLILALSIPAAYLLARRFSRPFDQLSFGARKLADGDFGHKISISGIPEVADLARTFNTMTDRLAESFAQVEQDREQLRTILSGMVEGVVAFDNEQRVLFANDRAAQLLEFPSENAVGRKLWEVTKHRSIHEAAEKALRGTGPYREEFTGAAEKSIALYVSRLHNPNTPGAVMVLHDTTDLRRLERLRQDFVANVSHELKTPLANIKSSVEVLLDGAAEDPNSRMSFLSEIEEQANRLDALVADLLSLARIESGAASLEFESVSIEDAVHACLDRHRTRAEGKGLILNGVSIGNCPQDLAVWADEEALAQVLDNLVDNAIKYTPRGGRITARWEATEQLVNIEVEDTGIGIPDRDLPRVFERFYRVDKARSREMGGTGLGLAIVKHTVQSMNGSVRVASQVNTGTTFRFCLPRSASASD